MMNDLLRLVAAVEQCGADIAPSYDEYTLLAFAIATDCGEAGRDSFHRLCRPSAKYDARNADRLFSAAVASGRGDVHLGSAFWLAKQHGVEVGAPPSSPPQGTAAGPSEKCKNAMHAAEHFPTHTRVPYNMAESDTACGADGTEDTADGDGAEPLSESSEPFQPLPVFAQDYAWPAPLGDLLRLAETPQQRDVLLLGLLNVIGCTLAPYTRTLYGGRWLHPTMQTFIVAPPASGKGAVAWCRHFVEPLHERVRRATEKAQADFRQEKKAYELLGREKSGVPEPQQPPNRMFLIAGDNSSTGIAQNVIESGGNGLILETEADTVSAAIGTDYGKWSHLLRDFFDHGRVSYNRRLNQEYREIGTTLVGVLLSGTPAQVPPLIPSAENGLFSRQLFYYMPSLRQWRSQFGDGGTDIRSVMRDKGADWLRTLDEVARQGNVRFGLTPDQQRRFDGCFSGLFGRCHASGTDEMAGSLARLGVNVLRMANVVAVLRHLEHHGPRFEPAAHVAAENVKDGAVGARQVGIGDDDFRAVLALAEPLYLHAVHILSFLKRCEVRNRNMSDRDRLLAAVPPVFTRREWTGLAVRMGVPENTALSWLQRLLRSGVIRRLEERGKYAVNALPESLE